MSEDHKRRPIRSFVLRQGRLTKAQQRALEQLGPRFLVEYHAAPLDLAQLFGREAKRVLEIGFGDGRSLSAMAAANPDTDYIGVEVHRPGVGSLLQQIEQLGLTNVRIISADVMEVLNNMMPDNSLDSVYLFFPDPWHKKRHHKRRLVQPTFVELIRRKLRAGGIFHVATDWQDYAEHVLTVMDQVVGFENMAAAAKFMERPDYRPLTKFEQRGQRLGHGTWDLIYKYQA